MIDNISAWLKNPYDGEMSAFGWFALVGLIIFSLIAWSRIIRLITE